MTEKQIINLKERLIITDDFIIPNESTLVVGANPRESKNGRTFYNDANTYLLDLKLKEVAIDTDKSRFIGLDLNDFHERMFVEKTFKQKFKTIIIDAEVIKFFESNFSDILRMLCFMIKDGGKLIFLKKSQKVESFLDLYKNNNNIIPNTMLEEKPVNVTMDDNIEAKEVYYAIYEENPEAIENSRAIIKKDEKCVIITINPSSSKGGSRIHPFTINKIKVRVKKNTRNRSVNKKRKGKISRTKHG